MSEFLDIILDDQITCKKLRMQDIIDNHLPVALENLDLSHMTFQNGELPDLSFIEVRNNFDLSHTNVSSFKGFPKVDNCIDISNSNIKSLEGCPKGAKIIEMSNTEIVSFKGCPNSAIDVDAWKTLVSNFEGLPETLKRLSIGGTKIRDLKNCPKNIEDLTADFLEVSDLSELPKNLKILSISGSSIENFMGMPKSVEEVICYHNDKLKSLEGLNIETLKGVAIMSCPQVLTEEIDAYHKIIKARTLLEKKEIFDKFMEVKDDIIRDKEIERERCQYI